MAERFLPPPPPPFMVATASAPTNDNPQFPDRRIYRIDENNVAVQLVLPATNDTYIVQMPKDQIYRIPPPENAAVVERHRLPPQKSRRNFCSPCVCYAASALFGVAILAIVLFLIYKFTLSPQYPLFEIKSFSINTNPNPRSTSSAHHAPPQYHVGIEATNPNAVNSLVYVAGTAGLVLNGREVAKGQSPAVTQAAKQIDDFEVVLVGRSAAEPKAFQQSANKKAGKGGLKLTLKMSLHLKKKSWLVDHTDLVLVECEFEVGLASRQKGSATVKSQSCDYF